MESCCVRQIHDIPVRFTHLFEWPESRRANFHICILGDEELGAAMQEAKSGSMASAW
jgi:hypothetical protein